MSEILTNAVTQRNKMRDWRREVISRPVEEWVGQYMTVPMEDVEKLGGAAGDDDDDDDDEVFKLRPCLLGRLFVRTSNIGAKLSRYCELVLASRIYTVIRLVIAPVAFFNLAYLVHPCYMHAYIHSLSSCGATVCRSLSRTMRLRVTSTTPSSI
jgi:hypothetical protein